MMHSDEKKLCELRERAEYYRLSSNMVRSARLKERLFQTVIHCEAEIRIIEERIHAAA